MNLLLESLNLSYNTNKTFVAYAIFIRAEVSKKGGGSIHPSIPLLRSATSLNLLLCVRHRSRLIISRAVAAETSVAFVGRRQRLKHVRRRTRRLNI